MQQALSALVRAVQATHPGQILIVTGAGVSHASGIPTFRGSDPNAIWKRDVTELGTYQFFCENPAGSWQWYLSRFDKAEGARPNPGHLAITALERFQLARGGDFLLVTQNIDTLHEQAGTRRMLKVHGTSDRFRCSEPGCVLAAPEGSIAASQVELTAFRKNPVEANVPRCPSCGGLLRMHILWFDEYYTEHLSYGWEAVCRSAEEEARLVIFAGTSFSVGVTDLVLRSARRRNVPIFNIDPAPRVSGDGVTSLSAGAELVLVEVCKALGLAV
jgi:NAD-dependent deacetylase